MNSVCMQQYLRHRLAYTSWLFGQSLRGICPLNILATLDLWCREYNSLMCTLCRVMLCYGLNFACNTYNNKLVIHHSMTWHSQMNLSDSVEIILMI